MDPVTGSTESVCPKSLVPDNGRSAPCNSEPQTRHPDRKDTSLCDPVESYQNHPHMEKETASRRAASRHLFFALWLWLVNRANLDQRCSSMCHAPVEHRRHVQKFGSY